MVDGTIIMFLIFYTKATWDYYYYLDYSKYLTIVLSIHIYTVFHSIDRECENIKNSRSYFFFKKIGEIFYKLQ